MTSSPKENRDRHPEPLVVTASTLASWLRGNFPNVDSIEALVFEAGLDFSEIPPNLFGQFTSLQSICIPASVQFIMKEAFIPEQRLADRSCNETLQTVTFEAGSKLQRIETLAFLGCYSLTSICLPASVTEIGGGAFCNTAICDIVIESGNRNFVVCDHLVMDFERTCIIQYFGRDSDLMIPYLPRSHLFAPLGLSHSVQVVKFV
jgi:hypothetical protein